MTKGSLTRTSREFLKQNCMVAAIELIDLKANWAASDKVQRAGYCNCAATILSIFLIKTGVMTIGRKLQQLIGAANLWVDCIKAVPVV
jgi:hypothetical protein